MAVTEIHPITTSLNKALDYIENPDKTEGKMLCTGYGCVPETAYYQFNQVKEKANKNDGYLAFHLIQSLNKALDDVRIAERKGNDLLKGHKYTVLKKYSNLSMEKKNDIMAASGQ